MTAIQRPWSFGLFAAFFMILLKSLKDMNVDNLRVFEGYFLDLGA